MNTRNEGIGYAARALALACAIILAPVLAAANVITDRSGTLTTAATSQQVMQSKASRTYLMCQNPITATETLFLAIDMAASTTAGGVELAPGGSVTWQTTFVPTGAVFVNAVTAGHRFICKEG